MGGGVKLTGAMHRSFMQ